MRKYAIFIMLIWVAVLIHGYSLAAAAEPKYSQTRDIMKSGEIKGTLQCDTGSLLADAWVYTPGDSFTAVTDGAGNFILRFVPEGKYTLKISFDTGDGQIENVVVKPKMTTDLGLVKITCPVVNVCLGKKDGFPCDDDDICMANDVCRNGTCAGTPVDCNDWNPCTEDECVPVVGCTHQPLTGVACNDTNACTANDVCSNGTCAGTSIICNDWNHCTQDECDMKTGCAYKPLNGMPCDDGNACTTQDACTNGVCAGAPADCNDGNQCTDDKCEVIAGCLHQPLTGIPCDDGNACTVQDACTNGVCAGAPADCNDGNHCTEDVCDTKTGCTHKPLNGIPCDDGNACTIQDACTNGVCNGKPVTCDDNNPCTKDLCNVSAGCTHSPISDVPCDDASLCTLNDTCKLGVCSGQPIYCNDGDACTDDSCLPDKGCVHTRKTDPGCSN